MNSCDLLWNNAAGPHPVLISSVIVNPVKNGKVICNFWFLTCKLHLKWKWCINDKKCIRDVKKSNINHIRFMD